MRANRRDTNHREIISAFISRGWTVLDIADLKNCCDICITKRFQTVMVEIKADEKKKLTKGEESFMKKWSPNGHWRKVTSVEDVEQVDREFSARAGL